MATKICSLNLCHVIFMGQCKIRVGVNNVHCMQETKIIFEEKFYYFKMRSVKCREIFSTVVGRA